MAGHSLGQVTALVAAGVLTVDDGVRLAARRAEVTQAAADAAPGRMAALLGATLEQAEAGLRGGADACWLANDNAPGQVVIAGTAAGIEAAVARAAELGVRKAVPSRWAARSTRRSWRRPASRSRPRSPKPRFAAGRYPVVGNSDAAAHADGEGWRARLVDHLVSPVRWRESQLTLAAMGATTLVEIGGPGSLVAMAKRTVPDITSRGSNAPQHRRAAMTVDVLAGEQLLVPERVVISPVSGVFRPTPPASRHGRGRGRLRRPDRRHGRDHRRHDRRSPARSPGSSWG